MARQVYGYSAADVVINAFGQLVPGAIVTIYYEQYGGAQVTDLLDADGGSVNQVVADTYGYLRFSGPDECEQTLWGETGLGFRIPIEPIQARNAFTVVAGTTLDKLAGVDLTGLAPGMVLTSLDGATFVVAPTQSARVVRWIRTGDDGVGYWEDRPDVDEPYTFYSVGDPLAPFPTAVRTGEYPGHSGSIWKDTVQRDSAAES